MMRATNLKDSKQVPAPVRLTVIKREGGYNVVGDNRGNVVLMTDAQLVTREARGVVLCDAVAAVPDAAVRTPHPTVPNAGSWVYLLRHTFPFPTNITGGSTKPSQRVPVITAVTGFDPYIDTWYVREVPAPSSPKSSPSTLHIEKPSNVSDLFLAVRHARELGSDTALDAALHVHHETRRRLLTAKDLKWLDTDIFRPGNPSAFGIPIVPSRIVPEDEVWLVYNADETDEEQRIENRVVKKFRNFTF